MSERDYVRGWLDEAGVYWMIEDYLEECPEDDGRVTITIWAWYWMPRRGRWSRIRRVHVRTDWPSPLLGWDDLPHSRRT